MRRRAIVLISFLMILCFGIFTRLFGNNWDQGNHLHPDERFLTMVATAMQWPKSVSEYFNTDLSKLNPHNIGFHFYVYGTWPIVFVKFIAELIGMGDYGGLTRVGRGLSGVVDIVTLILVFFIGKKLVKLVDPKLTKEQTTIAGICGMGAYAIMAIPIQLSHFFTTDPYLMLFLTISLYLLLFPPSWKTGMLLGISVGCAMAAKISGILILPVIGLFSLLFISYNVKLQHKNVLWKTIQIKSVRLFIFYSFFIIFLFLSFRILMPYLFTSSGIISLNPKILQNWETLKSFNDPHAWFPPAVQWINQHKIISPFLSNVFIGLGLPLGIFCVVAFAWSLQNIRRYPILLLPISFIMIYFLYHAIGFAFPLRYFWPIYPILASLAGMLCVYLYKKYSPILLLLLFFLFSIWPVAFMAIYTRPHSRVAASAWIYQNIPYGSAISYEHWDDPLPLHLPGYPGSSAYKGIELPMYHEDTKEKWKDIQQKLADIDYVILSSNRVYGSILSAPEKYPQTSAFYKELFAGNLGFEKVAEFTSRPSLPFPIDLCIPIPFFHYGKVEDTHTCNGIEFIDDYVEESWTVYDHPKVTIFKRKTSY
ncbi:MAG: hypothetical protein N3A54_02185 [Patescibacteria group bacterium]|nr:hypothetical protein [Patescibacteria group bacterium]